MTSEPPVTIEWRGRFTDAEANRLHADAFETRRYADDEWPWNRLVAEHSLGWVTARAHTVGSADGTEGRLVGFLNVPWDGFIHAWLQDVMVDPGRHRSGIGVRLVNEARDRAAAAGCEWLHVDFESELRPFYFGACGFEPSDAGVMRL